MTVMTASPPETGAPAAMAEASVAAPPPRFPSPVRPPACDRAPCGSLSRTSPRPGAPPAGPPSPAIPSKGALIVRASTVRRAVRTAARVCTRCAAVMDEIVAPTLPSPAFSRATAVRAAAAAVRYWPSALVMPARTSARSFRSGIRRAILRAAANPSRAVRSVLRWNSDRSRPSGTPPPAEADRSASRAWASCSRAPGELILARTSPSSTGSPSATYSRAIVPSAGERSTAVARADTVAGASTTSDTSARSTLPSRTPPSPPPPVQALRTPASSAPAASTGTQRRDATGAW